MGMNICDSSVYNSNVKFPATAAEKQKGEREEGLRRWGRGWGSGWVEEKYTCVCV